MRAKVSVLIPAYNAEETIKRAIDSVPVRDDVEVIVWDDGSDDNTFEIAHTVLEERKGTQIWFNAENKGVAYTVNRLLDCARGEYVVLLGSDDWFIGEAFDKALDMLDGKDLVYFDLEINDGTIFHLSPETKTGYCGSVKFMKKEFVGNTRCLENKKSGEDYYFYQELLKKNPVEVFTNLVVKHYNFPREGSLSWKQRHGEFKPEEV